VGKKIGQSGQKIGQPKMRVFGFSSDFYWVFYQKHTKLGKKLGSLKNFFKIFLDLFF